MNNDKLTPSTSAVDVCRMCADYESGMRMKDVAKVHGVSVGHVHKMLHNTNCNIRKKGMPIGFKFPREIVLRRAAKKVGCRLSEDAKRRISEAHKCHFDGFNGIGHLKSRPDGYIAAYAPDHPNARADGYVMLHTIVMERHIGRYLKPNEVVHHINHIRNDNRLENLLLMDKHEHMSMHMRERYARRNDVSTH